VLLNSGISWQLVGHRGIYMYVLVTRGQLEKYCNSITLSSARNAL